MAIAAGSPECLAVVICESVVEDVRSHNRCILNTFNTIWASTFPVRHDRLTIFASLTSGHGTQPMEVRLVRYDGDVVRRILNLQGTVKFASPVDVVDITVELRQVPFEGPGDYEVQVWVGEALVRQRRLLVRLVPKEAKPQ